MVTFLQSVRQITSAAILVGLAVTATSSDAAAFRTRFDPLFNSSFSSTLGFNGEALIDVSNDCLAGPLPSEPVVEGSCTATLVSATLNFYDYPNPASIFDTINWPPTDFAGVAPNQLSVDATGKVNGMTLGTDLQGSLDFDDESTWIVLLNFGLSSAGAPGLPLLTLVDPNNGDSRFESGGPCTLVDGVDPCQVTAVWERVAVPEPVSLALVGVALAALGLTRRRKS